ncbi:MAG: acyltransferase [Ilumatobacteraceae bacterium]|nr:acyltransferase [Ilumatobacteraceae bacterium]
MSLTSDRATAVTPATASRIAYEPAIDGLRAFAVVAVLLFHADIFWAGGGYLGVSVFFTISGYVVTRSLLHRHEIDGRHSVSGFYTRRLKRLIPASMMTLFLIVIAGWIGWIPAADSGEMRAATLHYANWHQISSGTDYASAFRVATSEQSPVVHYWSLAVEEQFYLLWPLVFALVLKFARQVHVYATVGLFLILSAISLLWATSVRPETVYYSSLFRFPEILAGCVVAVVLWRTRVSVRFAPIAAVALAGIGTLIVLTDNATSSWPYRGLLPLFACLVALLIVSLQTDSLARRALSTDVLVRVGKMSYGIYLFHWPIFLAIDQLDLDRGISLILKFGLTFLAASLSLRLIENPVRRSSVGFGWALAATGVAMAAVLGANALLGPGSDTPGQQEYEAVGINPGPVTVPSVEQPSPTLAGDPEVAVTPLPSTSPTTLPPREFTNVLLVGDSTAEALGEGMVKWVGDADPDLRVSVAARGACGFVRGGEYTEPVFNAALALHCPDLYDIEVPELAPFADVVVMHVTLADTWDRSWDAGNTWLRTTDPAFRERLEADYISFVEQQLAAGVDKVVWIRPPVSSFASPGGELDTDPSFLNGGQQVIEDTIRMLEARWPGRVMVADMRAWFEFVGLTDDDHTRPDGTHLSADGAYDVASKWLGPFLADLDIG